MVYLVTTPNLNRNTEQCSGTTRSGLGSLLLDGPFAATDEDLKGYAGVLNGLFYVIGFFWTPLVLILLVF